MVELVSDTTNVVEHHLDQFLVVVDQSSDEAVPAGLRELMPSLRKVRDSMQDDKKRKSLEKLVQLARKGSLDEAKVALDDLFPNLQFENVVDILHLLYINSKDLLRELGLNLRGRRTRCCTKTSASRDTPRCQKFCCCRGT
jgi:hypothetical protein